MADKKRESAGSHAFAAMMPKHGDQLKMAERLGCTQDQVSRWASGDRKPDSQTRAKLQDELGIDWRRWDEAPPASEPSASAEPHGSAA